MASSSNAVGGGAGPAASKAPGQGPPGGDNPRGSSLGSIMAFRAKAAQSGPRRGRRSALLSEAMQEIRAATPAKAKHKLSRAEALQRARDAKKAKRDEARGEPPTSVVAQQVADAQFGEVAIRQLGLAVVT